MTALHVACQHRHDSMVQLLLTWHADVSATNDAGMQPLAVAAIAGSTAIVQMLVGAGAIVSAACAAGMTALHLACQHGCLSTAGVLLDNDAPLSTANTAGLQPLHLAAQHGHAEIVQLLLNRSGRGAAVEVPTADGARALHLASEQGHLQAVQVLLSGPWYADTRARWRGLTPAYVAACQGHTAVLEALLDAGCPASTLGHESQGNGIWAYRTPLAAAIQYKHAAAAQLLISRGALSNEDHEKFALCQAVYQQMPEVVDQLLTAGASLKAPCEPGAPEAHILEQITPLLLAVVYGNCQILRMLLAAGAQPNPAAGAVGQCNCPLHIAAKLGDCQIVQTLLDAGAQVNTLGAKGNTPLHVAARCGHTSVLQVLLSARAAVNCPNRHGATPLSMAAEHGHDAAVRKLLAVGAAVMQQLQLAPQPFTKQQAAATYRSSMHLWQQAQMHNCRMMKAKWRCTMPHGVVTPVVQALVAAAPDAIDQPCFLRGYTALMSAAKHGQVAVLQVLLEAGASLTASSPENGTALNIAAIHGQLSAVQVMLAHSSCAQQPVADLIASAFAARRTEQAEAAVTQAVFKTLLTEAKSRDSAAVRHYIQEHLEPVAAAMCAFMMDGWEAEAERVAHQDREVAAVQHLLVDAAEIMSELHQVGAFVDTSA